MPRHKSFIERFWEKVLYTETCWLWQGKKSKAGYGLVYCNGHYRMAHRVSFEIATGIVLPNDIDVLHHCDIRTCIKFEDLFLGTHTDNMQDMTAKGRSFSQKYPAIAAARIALIRVRPPVGEAHHWAQLTEDKVQRIRHLRAQGCKYIDIAQEVGVGKSTIGRVVNREKHGGWQHIP